MHLTVTSLQNSLMFGFIDAFLNLISEAHYNELLQTVLNESPAAEQISERRTGPLESSLCGILLRCCVYLTLCCFLHVCVCERERVNRLLGFRGMTRAAQTRSL